MQLLLGCNTAAPRFSQQQREAQERVGSAGGSQAEQLSSHSRANVTAAPSDKLHIGASLRHGSMAGRESLVRGGIHHMHIIAGRKKGGVPGHVVPAGKVGIRAPDACRGDGKAAGLEHAWLRADCQALLMGAQPQAQTGPGLSCWGVSPGL